MTANSLRIVVGITGGIAAYKSVSLVRAFVQDGHTVNVVATEAALNFVGRPTLEAISRNPVHTSLYDDVAEVRHVALGQEADVIVIAPATANTIASLAAGLAPDLLGNTVLAASCPVVIAPAMHTEMWENAATQTNIQTLRTRGYVIAGPGVGQLTGEDVGAGRMLEPEEIVRTVYSAITTSRPQQDLLGKRILITAGGTREPLDPVRFIGNRSTGKQGLAIALAAAARGAEVTLIGANLEVDVPATLDLREVSTTAELQQKLKDLAPQADVIIMTAAVADYRPQQISPTKLKKQELGDEPELKLVKNDDLLSELTAARKPGQLVIGFAAETEPDESTRIEIAKQKATSKKVDFLVLNHVGWDHGFASDDNTIDILSGAGVLIARHSGPKNGLAHRILDVIV